MPVAKPSWGFAIAANKESERVIHTGTKRGGVDFDNWGINNSD